MGGLFFSKADLGASATLTQEACALSEEQLTELYDGIFHRPLDAGARGYIGHTWDFALEELRGSQEHTQYSAAFSAMKALENAQREPGDLTEEEKSDYEDIIDSALSHVNEWAKTLPEQARADAVIGPEQAKAAIQKAYDNMDPVAQAAAERGLFQALKNIGPPANLPTPGR